MKKPKVSKKPSREQAARALLESIEEKPSESTPAGFCIELTEEDAAVLEMYKSQKDAETNAGKTKDKARKALFDAILPTFLKHCESTNTSVTSVPLISSNSEKLCTLVHTVKGGPTFKLDELTPEDLERLGGRKTMLNIKPEFQTGEGLTELVEALGEDTLRRFFTSSFFVQTPDEFRHRRFDESRDVRDTWDRLANAGGVRAEFSLRV